MSELVTVDHGAFQVTSNVRNAEDISAGLHAGDVAAGLTPADDADPGDETDAAATPEPAKPSKEASEAGRKLAGEAKAKRDKVQERIDKAVAAQRAAERERDALKTQLSSRQYATPAVVQPTGTAEQQIAQASSSEQKAAISALPALDKYDSIEAWQADVAAMIRKQALEDFRAEQSRDAEARAHEARLKTAQERIASFKEQHPDYDEVTQIDLPPSQASADIFAYLQGSDVGPQLAYELGKDRELLSRMLSQPDKFSLAAALGKLEGRIESRSSAADRGSAPKLVISNAKPPIKPLGSSPVVADATPDDIPFGPEYIRLMNQRERQAKRTR